MWLSLWTKPRVERAGWSVGGRGVRTCCSIRGCSKDMEKKKRTCAGFRRGRCYRRIFSFLFWRCRVERVGVVGASERRSVVKRTEGC